MVEVRTDSMERTCDSTKRKEFVGIATLTTSTCAVIFNFDDTPDKRGIEKMVMRAITFKA